MIGWARALLDRFALPAVMAALSGALLWSDALWRWDLLFYDWLVRARSRPAPRDVVIVAIDPASLAAIGRWPWPRRVHAELIAQLERLGVRAVALDIAFPEPDAEGGDEPLAEALRRSGRVVLPVLYEHARDGGGAIESLPNATLAQAAAALGHVDVELDPDGIARSVFLRAGLGTPRWPTLALALLSLDTPSALAGPALGEVDPSTEPTAPYFWRRDHRILVSFSGPPGRFLRVSYVDVLRGRADPAPFARAFVFVGPTATGLGDALPTPVSGLSMPMPGVEFNANVLETLRAGTAARYVGLSATLGITCGVVGLAVAACLLLRYSWFGLGAGLLTVVFGTAWLLRSAGLWVTPAPALLGIVVGYGAAVWRRRAFDARLLAREKERTETALQSLDEAVITTDDTGGIEYMNLAAEALTGYTLSEARGRPWREVVTLKDARAERAAVPADASPGARRIDAVLQSADGHGRAVRVSVVPIGAAGGSHGVVLALSSPSEVGQSVLEVGPAGSHDLLTGLPDRGAFRERLARAIETARRSRRSIAVLFLNIDRFRAINEGLGTGTGDLVLRAVAQRLRTVVGNPDDAARVGPDEFAGLFEDLAGERDAGAPASRVLGALSEPLEVDGRPLALGVSLGVSLFPRDGDDAESLLLRARAAMAWARERARARGPAQSALLRDPAPDPAALEYAVRQAAERHEFELAYQPQVDLVTGRLAGVEALLRWRHPEFGVLPPGTFVPVAEQAGLLDAIGERALRTACRQVAQWRAAGLPGPRVSVNVSAGQIRRGRLVSVAVEARRLAGLPPGLLAIEIAESAATSDSDSALRVMRALRAEGILVAIDGVGAGDASLGRLRHYPADLVKIDRSIVRDVDRSHASGTICLAILAIAHSSGYRVVAEGVDTTAQVDFLRARGCHEIQGHLVGRAAGADEIERLLRRGGALLGSAS